MIEPQEFVGRRKKFLAALPANSIAVIANGSEQLRKGHGSYPFAPRSDFYYLTGFTEADAIAVFIPGEKNAAYTLFCREPNPETEVWIGKCVGQEDAVKKFGADQAFIDQAFPEFLKEFSAENPKATLYFSEADNDLHQLLDECETTLTMENSDKFLGNLRLVKSKAEVEIMQHAADISSQAHQHVMEICKSGLKEYQLEADFIHYCSQRGARFQAYTPIFAAGENACTLHYEANEHPLDDGELILVDAGCEYQHYASDITRTYPVNGKFTTEQKSIYELVLKTQLAVIELVKPGVSFDTLQETTVTLLTTGLVELGLLQGDVEKLIADKAYSDFYMHGVSHWLGLDVHDAGGYKVAGEIRKLQAGNVLTVEPGIYIAKDNSTVDKKWRGIGVRIEDDVLVTETGSKVLSTAPKNVNEIEKIMSKVNV